MKIETIAVDMDDVLVNLLEAWLNFLNKKHNLSVKKSDVVDWDMKKVYPTLSDKELYGVLNLEELWQTVTPLPYAYHYLKRLYDEGYKIKVVTASHYKTIAPKLINALFPYYNFLTYKDIIVCSDKKLIQADIIVDDYHENLRGCKGVKFLMNAPYNQNIDTSIYDFRISNLKELYLIIKQLEKVEDNV